MSALTELINLSEEKGYENWDTGDYGGRSWTFGKESVFCLHVRFDKFWRITGAIYVKFENGSVDQYVYSREKNKRDKVYWILNFLPDNLDSWDELFK